MSLVVWPQCLIPPPIFLDLYHWSLMRVKVLKKGLPLNQFLSSVLRGTMTTGQIQLTLGLLAVFGAWVPSLGCSWCPLCRTISKVCPWAPASFAVLPLTNVQGPQDPLLPASLLPTWRISFLTQRKSFYNYCCTDVLPTLSIRYFRKQNACFHSFCQNMTVCSS